MPTSSQAADVSFVVPVYDAAPYVEAAVRSALTQTQPPREVVVVDDGSRDGSAEILAQLAAEDDRVVVVSHGVNRGHAAALNSGIGSARSVLVAILDADDEALPTRLEHQVPVLEERKEVAVVGGAVAFVGSSGEHFVTVPYPEDAAAVRARLETSSPLVHSAATIRRTVLQELGGYRAAFSLALDYDLWLRVAERYELVNAPEVVVRYRIHGAQGSAQLQRVAVETIAARLAARARAAGREDPIPEGRVATDELRRRLALDDRAVGAAVTEHACWYGKTLARAGDPTGAEEVFVAAEPYAATDRELAERLAAARAAVSGTARRRWRSGLPRRRPEHLL